MELTWWTLVRRTAACIWMYPTGSSADPCPSVLTPPPAPSNPPSTKSSWPRRWILRPNWNACPSGSSGWGFTSSCCGPWPVTACFRDQEGAGWPPYRWNSSYCCRQGFGHVVYHIGIGTISFRYVLSGFDFVWYCVIKFLLKSMKKKKSVTPFAFFFFALNVFKRM